MDVTDCIKKRRSIRKFKPGSIPWDSVCKIVEAGLHAPSAGNMQNWKFIVVSEKERRNAIAEAAAQQYWMAQAPIHIVITADVRKAREFYGIRGERLYAVQNCAAAVENMLLAAHSLGIGSCWVGAFDEEKLRSILEIRDPARPQVIVVLGYADEEPPEPLKYRLMDVMYVEKWKRGQSPIQDLDDTLGYWGGVARKRMNYAREKTMDKAAELKQKMTKRK